jgi:magnesium transporter
MPLDVDEDLSAMYLSAKMAHQPRGLTDHEELELLLESFSKQVEEIVSELDTLTVSSYPFICCGEYDDTEGFLIP